MIPCGFERRRRVIESTQEGPTSLRIGPMVSLENELQCTKGSRSPPLWCGLHDDTIATDMPTRAVELPEQGPTETGYSRYS